MRESCRGEWDFVQYCTVYLLVCRTGQGRAGKDRYVPALVNGR